MAVVADVDNEEYFKGKAIELIRSNGDLIQACQCLILAKIKNDNS